MGRTKRAAQPPDEGLVRIDAGEVRKRLSEFVRVRFDNNWSEFARAIGGVQNTTVEGWKLNKKRWPSFEPLMKIAELRLSLDWLVTGQGNMLHEPTPPQTDVGRMMQMLRPRIQNKADVSDFVELQAFGQLLIHPGIDGLIDLAAEGFVQRYRETKQALQYEDKASRLSAWLLDELEWLRKSLQSTASPTSNLIPGSPTVEAIEAKLDEVVRKLEVSQSGWLRLRGAWATMNRVRAERAEMLIRQAEEMGLNPNAFTAAGDVAEAVRATQQELADLREQVQGPYQALMNRMGYLGSVLEQLSDRVAALQPPRKQKGRPNVRVGPRKKRKSPGQ